MNRIQWKFLVSIVATKLKTFQDDLDLEFPSSKNHEIYIEKEHSERIKSADEYCKNFMNEKTVPGMVVSVTADGKKVWQKGYGERDIENHVHCSTETSMLISSISKPLTVAVLMKLIELDLLHLNDDVSKHVEEFPRKYLIKDNKTEDASVLIKQLAAHTSGIRHYKHDDEGLLYEKYDVIKSLDLFKNDELVSFPGKDFNYSTFGYSLLSAAMQKCSGMDFIDLMLAYFKKFHLLQTFPDENEHIIFNRSRLYSKQKNDKNEYRVVNSPRINCSYKWAGGGFTSTSDDLIRFANLLMFAYQNPERSNTILSSKSVELMWTPTFILKNENSYIKSYGLGWFIEYFSDKSHGYNTKISHSGAGQGNSNILLMKLKTNHLEKEFSDKDPFKVLKSQRNIEEKRQELQKDLISTEKLTFTGVKGVVVVILANMKDLNLKALADFLADNFSIELA